MEAANSPRVTSMIGGGSSCSCANAHQQGLPNRNLRDSCRLGRLTRRVERPVVNAVVENGWTSTLVRHVTLRACCRSPWQVRRFEEWLGKLFLETPETTMVEIGTKPLPRCIFVLHPQRNKRFNKYGSKIWPSLYEEHECTNVMATPNSPRRELASYQHMQAVFLFGYQLNL